MITTISGNGSSGGVKALRRRFDAIVSVVLGNNGDERMIYHSNLP